MATQTAAILTDFIPCLLSTSILFCKRGFTIKSEDFIDVFFMPLSSEALNSLNSEKLSDNLHANAMTSQDHKALQCVYCDFTTNS